MKKPKITVFETMILFVGIVLTFFGFRIVTSLYMRDGSSSWEMMIAIFLWLILLVMFILLSLGVETGRRQLEEIKLLKEIIFDEVEEVKLMKTEVAILSGKPLPEKSKKKVKTN